MSTPTADPLAQRRALARAFAAAPQLAPSADLLAETLRTGSLGGFEATSPLAAVLVRFLSAAGWRGAGRDLAEALPHFVSELDLTDVLNVLARLGLAPRRVRAGLAGLDARMLPAIALCDSGEALVLLAKEGAQYRVFSGATRTETLRPAAQCAGEIHVLAPADRHDEGTARESRGFVARLAARFTGGLAVLSGLTAALNLLALVVPLFTMAVYDTVIPTGNTLTLAALGLGVGLALLIEAGFRILRSAALAFTGARVEHLTATAVFSQILMLPPAQTELAPVGAQAARIKDLDSLRDLFAGQIATALFDLPFALLFIAIIALIGGPLALVPCTLLVLYLLLALAVRGPLRRAVQRSAHLRARKQSLLIDLFGNIRTIKQMAAEAQFAARHRALSADTAMAQLAAAQLTSLVHSASQMLMAGAGLAVIAAGAHLVVAGAMSVGALIAVMALTWRVLAPLQTLFLTLTRAEQVLLTLRQISHVMALPSEAPAAAPGGPVERKLYGAVAIDRLSFRYRPTLEPALVNVSLAVKPGAFLAIMGGNSAGKSTLLAMVLAMHRPQAGQVLIDGVDVRQIDPRALRRQIAYVPQHATLFHGTIAQNLRLGNPTASADALQAVCDEIGLTPLLARLPEGLDTRLGDQSVAHFSTGFKQRLSLGRALLRRAPLLLLDEPGQALDEAGDRALIATLGRLKGRSTILMVSHRPSHIALADAAVIMDAGRIVWQGPPQEAIGRTKPQLRGAAA